MENYKVEALQYPVFNPWQPQPNAFNQIPFIEDRQLNNVFNLVTDQLKYNFDRLQILEEANINGLEIFNTATAGTSPDLNPLVLNAGLLSAYITIVDKKNAKILDSAPLQTFVRTNGYDIKRLQVQCGTEVDWQKSYLEFPNRAALNVALNAAPAADIVCMIYYSPIVRQNPGKYGVAGYGK